MLDDTCIWPGCRKMTGFTTVEKLCITHVSVVLAEHERSLKRGNDDAAQSARPVKWRGPNWFEQRKMDAMRDAPWPDDTADEGFIYYLRIGGHYKIGWAKRLEQRLKAYPPDGAVLAVHDGSRQDEGKLHKRFAHLTTAGREWYPLVPDITRHIQIMVEQHGEPDPELRCGPKPVGIKRPKHYRDGPASRGWNGGKRAS